MVMSADGTSISREPGTRASQKGRPVGDRAGDCVGNAVGKAAGKCNCKGMRVGDAAGVATALLVGVLEKAHHPRGMPIIEQANGRECAVLPVAACAVLTRVLLQLP